MAGRQSYVNRSLRQQLSFWLAIVTVLSGIVAGACSFLLSLREAHRLQDDQLRQVAIMMGRAGRDVFSQGDLAGITCGRDRDARIVIHPLAGPMKSFRERWVLRAVGYPRYA